MIIKENMKLKSQYLIHLSIKGVLNYKIYSDFNLFEKFIFNISFFYKIFKLNIINPQIPYNNKKLSSNNIYLNIILLYIY